MTSSTPFSGKQHTFGDQKLNRKISLIINILGLSCLGGAVFLQVLVFSGILVQGFFQGVEANSVILMFEIALIAFLVVYFVYSHQSSTLFSGKPHPFWDQRLNHKISLIVNVLGLSCLGGAIFLQVLVFSEILLQGYFRGVETNPVILMSEITLTAFSVVYFVYIYQKVIRLLQK